MNIKVLGSGSRGNAYVLDDGKTRILLEAGVPTKTLMEGVNFNLHEIKGVLITHKHGDHCITAPELARRGQKIWLNQETQSKLNLPSNCVNLIGDMQQFAIGTYLIRPFAVKHINTMDGDDCENYGFLIYSLVTKERLLYATDCMYINPQFKGLNYIMIEVNYDDDVENDSPVEAVEKRRLISHMSLETAIKFLESNDLSEVKKIIAIHLSDNRTIAEDVLKALRRATGKSVVIARAGVEV